MVDTQKLRYAIDGERFVILLQAMDSQEDIDEQMDPLKVEGEIQRFITRTSWIRKKSQSDDVVPTYLSPRNADAQ
jgi:hypothetical protein